MAKIACQLEQGETLIPLGFQVLVEIEKEEKVTEGGIIIPEKDRNARRAGNIGTVLAVGPLAGKDPGDCPENWGAVVGNKVCFEAYEGQPYLTHDGRVLICFPEKEIYSMIVKETKR